MFSVSFGISFFFVRKTHHLTHWQLINEKMHFFTKFMIMNSHYDGIKRIPLHSDSLHDICVYCIHTPFVTHWMAFHHECNLISPENFLDENGKMTIMSIIEIDSTSNSS